MKKSTRVLSLILAVMMLFSAFSILASAKNVDVAETSATVSSDGTARLYFNMAAVSWWNTSSAGGGNYAYFFNNSTNKNAWSTKAVAYSGNTYYVTIPSGDWAGVILTRNSVTSNPSWDNKWNQTGDITMSSTSNYISKFADGSTSVTWGTAVKPASTATVTASADTVEVGGTVDLSAALTSNADINTVKSVAYTATNGTVANGVFTADAAGEATVTATVTYYPNGYSSLTSTATATTTITVTEQSEVDPDDPVVDPTEETEEPTDPPVDKTELFDTIGAAVDYDMSLENWTEESWNAMQEKLAAAREVYADENATQEDVNAATQALRDAIDGLEVEPIAKTVYCIDSAKWGTVCAYAWTEGGAGMSWPGTVMTKTADTVNGFDVYEITIDVDYGSIIFNNNDAGKQTADLAFEEGKYYDIKAGAWYDSLADVPVVDPLSTDRYLVGSFNGWSTLSHEFKLDAEGSSTGYVSIDLEANTEYEFKVIREGAWTSNTTAITDSKTGLTFSSSTSANAKITTKAAGTYVFSFGMSNSQLSVTYPVEPTEAPTEEPTDAPTEPEATPDAPTTEPETEATVVIPAGYYLVGTLNGAECWFVDENSADRMLTANPGNEGEYMLHYTFTEGDEVKVAYFDGTAITAWYQDGSDNNYTIGAEKAGAGTIYFRPEGNDTWSYYFFTVLPDVVEEPTQEETQPEATEPEATEPEATEPEATEPEATGDEPATEPEATEPEVEPTEPEATEYITIYFQNNWLWENVCCYTWDANGDYVAAWPGAPMEFYANDGTYDVYVANIPVGNSFIINGIKDDGTGDRDQTPTITDAVDGRCYYMLWDNGNAVGYADIDVIVPPEEPTEAPTEAPTEKYTWKTSYVSTHSTVTVNWTITGAQSVNVYFGTSSNALELAYTSEELASSYTFDGLNSETTYYYKVVGVVDGAEKPGIFVSARTKAAPTKVDGVTVTDVAATTIDLEWNAIENATKYWVYANNAVVLCTTDTAATIEVDDGTTYELAVTALLADGTLLVYEDADKVEATTDKISYKYTTSATKTCDAITINWTAEASSKAWVYFGTSMTDLKLLGSSTNNTYTINGLKPGTSYYYKLSFLFDDGVIRMMPLAVNVKTEAFDADVQTELTEDGLTVSWNAYEGATKYWVIAGGVNRYILATTDTEIYIRRNVFDSTDNTVRIKALYEKDGRSYITEFSATVTG